MLTLKKFLYEYEQCEMLEEAIRNANGMSDRSSARVELEARIRWMQKQGCPKDIILQLKMFDIPITRGLRRFLREHFNVFGDADANLQSSV